MTSGVSFSVFLGRAGLPGRPSALSIHPRSPRRRGGWVLCAVALLRDDVRARPRWWIRKAFVGGLRLFSDPLLAGIGTLWQARALATTVTYLRQVGWESRKAWMYQFDPRVERLHSSSRARSPLPPKRWRSIVARVWIRRCGRHSLIRGGSNSTSVTNHDPFRIRSLAIPARPLEGVQP